MKNEIAILGSDSVTRSNLRFTAGALESSLRQRWCSGTPCNLGHDQTRMIGWMTPLSVYFQPGLTLLMGVFTMPESTAEDEALSAARVAHIRHDHWERCRPHEAALRARIGQHLTADAAMVDAGVPSFSDADLAVRCFPQLFNAVNKDGLVSLAGLRYLGDGVFDVGGLALFGHALFRRSGSLLNHVNHHFFNTFLDLGKDGHDLWVALDRDLVGWSAAYQPYIELEYWWGPKFQDDLGNIPVGVARHEATDFDRLYSGVLRTECWWQSRKGEHILEVEELKDVPYADGRYHCRYLHCIVDEASGVIKHVDGAIRTYSHEQMLTRMDQPIDIAGRQTGYTKLWRLDAALPVAAWKQVISDFFAGNHLVGEYLGAERESKVDRPQTAATARSSLGPKARWVPYSIARGEGVRVNLAYHATEPGAEPRRVRPIDTLSIGDDTYLCVSLWTVELQKVLRRSGHDLCIPEGLRFAACEDLYVNLPVIVHNSAARVPPTLDAVARLLRWTAERGHDRAVATTIAYPLTDRDVQISVYGHAQDLLNMWEIVFADLPTDDAAANRYVDRIARALGALPARPVPVATELVRTSGVLWLNRRLVEPAMNMEPQFDPDSGRLQVTMALPPQYHDLGRCLAAGELSVRVCTLVDRVRCSRCNADHLTCDCSVVLDGARKYIEKVIPAGFVITDKPA